MDAEWRILRRHPTDLSTQDNMLDLAVSVNKATMFPILSSVIRKMLLLPVGTATVERSFSTMNRILSSQRCRLLPNHACQLMQLSIEGPGVVDVRDGTDCEQKATNALIDKAYEIWLEQPRRGVGGD
jgi:hAT family C-terminal dimerisation region